MDAQDLSTWTWADYPPSGAYSQRSVTYTASSETAGHDLQYLQVNEDGTFNNPQMVFAKFDSAIALANTRIPANSGFNHAYLEHIIFTIDGDWNIKLTRNGSDFTADSVSVGSVNVQINTSASSGGAVIDQNRVTAPGATAGNVNLTESNPSLTLTENTGTPDSFPKSFEANNSAYGYFTGSGNANISANVQIDGTLDATYVNASGTAPSVGLDSSTWAKITSIQYVFGLDNVTPEPTSMALLMVGAVIFGLRRRHPRA